jgi:hypothetical protein
MSDGNDRDAAITTAFNILSPALGPTKNQNPPVWIIGSGMTVSGDSGIVGVPSTKDFARRYLEVLESDVLEGESPKMPVVRELRKALDEPNSDSGEIYRQASGIFHEQGWQDQLMVAIRGLVLSPLPENDRPQKLDEPKDLERLVWNKSGNWNVRPGLRSLAAMIKLHPNRENHAIFTTNFDPLISATLTYAEQPHARVIFESEDYPLTRVAANVPVVYHVHGYWTGSSTLNTSSQLIAGGAREKLAHSIASLLVGRNIIVMGYGGWEDVMMLALRDAIKNENTKIYWCARDAKSYDIEKIQQLSAASPRFYRVLCPDIDALLSRSVQFMKERKSVAQNVVAMVTLAERYRVLELERNEKVSHRETLALHTRELAEIKEKAARAIEDQLNLLRLLDKIGSDIERMWTEGKSIATIISALQESTASQREQLRRLDDLFRPPLGRLEPIYEFTQESSKTLHSLQKRAEEQYKYLHDIGLEHKRILESAKKDLDLSADHILGLIKTQLKTAEEALKSVKATESILAKGARLFRVMLAKRRLDVAGLEKHLASLEKSNSSSADLISDIHRRLPNSLSAMELFQSAMNNFGQVVSSFESRFGLHREKQSESFQSLENSIQQVSREIKEARSALSEMAQKEKGSDKLDELITKVESISSPKQVSAGIARGMSLVVSLQIIVTMLLVLDLILK